MPNVLFAWESGGGLGHLLQMRPLAEALVRRGHRVHIALRHLSAAAADVLGNSGVRFRQAPFKSGGPRPGTKTQNFADVLVDTGWADAKELFILAYGWRGLMEDVRPELLVFDHASTALLASRGLPFPVRRVVIGSGFCVPPDLSPLPPLVSDPVADPERMRQREQRVLARANHVLHHWGRPLLERLGQLFSQVDGSFLTTFEELEQCPSRGDAEYWGPVLPDGGAEPKWPAGQGKKVFAYSKRFDGLEPLAAMLRDSGRSAVLYVDGLTEPERRRMAGPLLHVESKRVDLRRAAAECDAAVLHAGQGATAAVLLAGKPVLQIPLVLEQRLTAEATVRLGAGEIVNDRAKDIDAARAKLEAVLTEDRYTEAARRFAQKYSDFDPAAQVKRMVARVEELIETGRQGQTALRQARDRETRGHGEKARNAGGKVFAG